MFTISGPVLKQNGPLDGPLDGPWNGPEPPKEPAAKVQKLSEDMAALRNGLLFYFFITGFFII